MKTQSSFLSIFILRICALVLFLWVVLSFQPTAYAASAPKFNPKGVKGWAGAGFANFVIKEPVGGARVDRAQFAALGGEKGFNFLNLFLTFGFNYIGVTGQTQYFYETLSSETYSATDVNFRSELFQASLGLKMVLIDAGWFKPYAEGGGMFGYFTNKYDFNATQRAALDSVGTNYKKEDSVMDMGNYVEGGLELYFSDSFGLKAAARFIKSDTKEIDTLNKRKVKYEAEIYYLGLLKTF